MKSNLCFVAVLFVGSCSNDFRYRHTKIKKPQVHHKNIFDRK